MDKKALTLPILVSLVVGNMIGTGIYILPASLAPFGYYSLLAWGFTSLGALFLALTFAHLSKRFPQTGGPITYCQAAFGHLPGFLVANIYWASNLVSIAALVISSVGYLGYLTPWLDSNNPLYQPWMSLAIELGLVWLFAIINIIGVHTAGLTQLYLTIIKILPLVLISLIGLHSVHMANFTLPPLAASGASTGFSQLAAAAGLTFWAFIGLESATVPSENTEGYSTIFKATVYGTLITASVYILSSFVLQGMIPAASLQSSQFPFAEAAVMLFGKPAAFVIAFCAFISGIGALNGCILLQGQIVYAAAREHYFPKAFSHLSKHDVPIAGQLFSTAVISALLLVTMQHSLLKQFDHVALLAVLLTLITYLLTSLASLKFVMKDKLAFSKTILIPGIALLYSAWMIASFGEGYLLTSVGLTLLILPFYFLTKKYRT